MAHKDMALVESKVFGLLEKEPELRFFLMLAPRAALFLWALVSWGWQIYRGMCVTGLNAPIFWGIYIVNFVFFIGVSHAGTLISSILRITDAAWRRPFTRIAESITIASLPFAGSSVIVDLGRPDRALNVLLTPHLTSPILWDVICISTYMAVSCLYFFIALVPDLASCRDKLKGIAPWRAALYRLGAMGWQNTHEEMAFHNRVMGTLSIILLTLVISVHTNVGFIFGMTSKPGWHSASIGPYFVIGAAFQGLAGLAIIMPLVRKFLGLETIITEAHLGALKKFLIAMCCFWAYFTFTELLTAYYGQHAAEAVLLHSKFTGQYAPLFWGMLTLCLFIPLPLLVFGRGDIGRVLFWTGISVNIGMWLERFDIVVPSAALTLLGWREFHYYPSWVEVSQTVGWLAGFVLLLVLLLRYLPILTVWEMEEEERGIDSAPPALKHWGAQWQKRD
ncbi:MAG: NrfD/PsrC family molybdoenzyme membrane anchor subunit [Elusimicrobiota bacterium]